MKCIVCDRCKTIIENPRRCRVITCARPLKPRTGCDKGKIPYHGNDPQQNDILWGKEICDKCLDELEAFFESGNDVAPHPPEPAEPDPDRPGESGEGEENHPDTDEVVDENPDDGALSFYMR